MSRRSVRVILRIPFTLALLMTLSPGASWAFQPVSEECWQLKGPMLGGARLCAVLGPVLQGDEVQTIREGKVEMRRGKKVTTLLSVSRVRVEGAAGKQYKTFSSGNGRSRLQLVRCSRCDRPGWVTADLKSPSMSFTSPVASKSRSKKFKHKLKRLKKPVRAECWTLQSPMFTSASLCAFEHSVRVSSGPMTEQVIGDVLLNRSGKNTKLFSFAKVKTVSGSVTTTTWSDSAGKRQLKVVGMTGEPGTGYQSAEVKSKRTTFRSNVASRSQLMLRKVPKGTRTIAGRKTGPTYVVGSFGKAGAMTKMFAEGGRGDGAVVVKGTRTIAGAFGKAGKTGYATKLFTDEDGHHGAVFTFGGNTVKRPSARTTRPATRTQVSVSASGLIGDRAGRAGVGRVIARKNSAVRRCYEAALHKRPGRPGKVAVKFTVGVSGSITSVDVLGASGGLSKCIKAKFMRIRGLPRLRKPASFTQSYAFSTR